MTTNDYHPWLHRLAVMTAAVALLPIVIGAVVTTLDAGMAFPDWPSSDGQGMFAYPWLKSAGDKFVEHGHRLAGILIGLFSIGLTVAVWSVEKRTLVRVAGTLVLLCVIAQGLLGGARVLANDPRIAMLHGVFAAWVFTLMASVALFTSRSWLLAPQQFETSDLRSLKPLAVMTPLVIFAQYLLGGVLRHLGSGLYEHLGFAVVVLLFVIMTAIAARRSGISWLKRVAYLLLSLVLIQAALGGASWMTKYGLASAGYVAIQHSTAQVVVRTAHTVVGMLVFMTSVVYALQVFRLDAMRTGRVEAASEPSGLSGALTMPGGAG